MLLNTLAIIKYLEKHPLSTKEIDAGSCIRLVKCTRTSRFRLAWVLLFLKDAPIKKSEVLKPAGISKAFFYNSEVFSGNEKSIPGPGACTWYAKEYEINAFYFAPLAAVVCGDTKTLISCSERKKVRKSYWQAISHAARCKDYSQWAEKNRKKRLFAREIKLSSNPLISIITPIYETPPKLLEEMIQSVMNQDYQNWEHILVNASPKNADIKKVLAAFCDQRMKVLELEKNEGIVGNTNLGIKAACGDYVSFLDHDDLLENDALSWVVRTAEQQDHCVDLIYCDEDSIDESGALHTPILKPSLNIDLLYSNNYILHLLTISRHIIDQVTRSDESVEGAQDYDLALKAIELSKNCARIPEFLYHWRSHKGSTNSNPDSKKFCNLAGQTALKNHFSREGLHAEVTQERTLFTYQSTFQIQDESAPSIACIVVGLNASAALRDAVEAYNEVAGSKHARIVQCKSNEVSDINRAIDSSHAELILLASRNISKLSTNFLKVLAGYFQRKGVFAVSPKVIRIDGLIDYAGIAVRPDGHLMRLNRFMFEGARTYLGRDVRPYNSAVLNAEYCMIRSSDLREYGGLNSMYTTLDYALAEACVRAQLSKKLCVFTPFVKVFQSEYKTLLTYCEHEDAASDISHFQSQFGMIFKDGDPSHNPNFEPYSPYYQLRGYKPVSADSLAGEARYLIGRAFGVLRSNGIKNVVRTTQRYLKKGRRS